MAIAERVKQSARLVQVVCAALALWSVASVSSAAERLCDPAFEDCRTPLINLINNENIGIDVAFWFMQDTRYESAIIARWKAGVPVRVLVDPKANPTYVGNAQVLADLAAAGIPMRYRLPTAPGILHWKMMLFAGQNTVQFSGANYSPTAFIYQVPYSDYEDETPYFSDDPSIVNSFKTRYDDLWLDTTYYGDYANITAPRARVYPIFTKDPGLNFPQQEDYALRILKRYAAENTKIDVIMYRITDQRHTDAMIAAMQRGVPVRIISDTFEYRDPNRLWAAYNLDKLWAAGIPLRVRAHAGLNHQKLVIMYSQAMAVFGSSNWTSPSANQQQEHNYFTTKPWMFQWFVDQFERKWNNLAPNGAIETDWFQPLPPDRPTYLSPPAGAVGADRSLQLKWDAGPWGQLYDIYFGTDPNPPLFAANQQLGPTEPDTPTLTQKWTLPLLQPGTTYYWKIVSKTMAGMSRSGPISSFTTGGTAPPPPQPSPNASTIVIWAATDVPPGNVVGNWQLLADSTAAGGQALWNPDRGQSKISPPLAAPANYFDTTFNAVTGVPYHLWLRMRAQGNSTANNAVSVQFDDAIDQYGSPLYPIGSTQGAEIVLQDPSGTLSGWGWDDNGFGAPATLIYFSWTGPHRLRIQQRTDGAIVDQIVLSPDAFLSTPPGATINDATIYGSTIDGAAPPPSPPPTPAPPPPIPAPWTQQDIGEVGMPGYANFDGATSSFFAEAAGADVWGNADSFHYIYQPLSGDGSIVARVAALQNTNVWTKAGVMIRESLAPGATNAYMLVSASKGLAYQGRTSTNAITSTIAGPLKGAPYWVRLERAGNTFTGYRSLDGITWTLAGSYTIAMAPNVFVGLALTSHNVDATATATFDNVSVNGTPTCGFVVSPSTQSISSAAGSATFSVSTGASCTWTAASRDTTWLTVGAGASGKGNGTVTVDATANAAGARSATVTIAGQGVTVSQAAAPCTYTISPSSASFAAAGETATIAISAGSWCTWTATSSDASWLGVTSAASGSGNGTVTVSAAANSGPARAATITIGGQMFTASQAAGPCTYSISPASMALAAAGGTATITVTTGSWCSWNAASNDTTWLTVASGSGTGNGTVTLTASPNSGGSRSATATIAGQTFTATQMAAPCSFAIAPASQAFASNGGTTTVTVTASSWCSWSAATNAAWISVTAAASGTGNGTVTLAVASNAAGSRTGTVTIAGQTFTVTQDAAPCSYAISPASQAINASGGDAPVAVTTGSWCSWTATSNATWMSIAAGASATGSGTATVSVSANTDAARSGTVTIAGQTFTVTQAAAPCSNTIAPATQTIGADGGSLTVNVTAAAWCSWTAVSNTAWLTLVSGASGTGNGVVSFSVPANTGTARSGTAAIAGQTFTVSQSAPGLPAGWLHDDIGAVGVAGGAGYDAATFAIAGAGADVWDTADALHYAYQSWTGDGRIIARVVTVQNTNAWVKAGVMFRETLDPGSAHAFMLESFSKGLAFQRRTTTNGLSTSTAGAISAAPYWVRLDRVGDTFTAYQSPDGVMWTLVGTDTIPMAATVLVGLGVSSHTTTGTATATFDNVSATAVSLPVWTEQDIGSVGIAGTATYDPASTTFTVKAAGADIWGSADAFHFAYRRITGDAVLVARVATLQNTNVWAKAGVMIRETLDPGSVNALMLVSAAKGLSFQRRQATGGLSVATAGALVAAPYWVKLERIGNTFNAYSSADGAAWTLVGSDTISMGATVYVGLATTSHTTAAAATATFDNVTVR